MGQSYEPELVCNGYFQGVTQTRRHPDLNVELRVDGKGTEGRAVLRARSHHECRFRGPRVSETSRRPYVFSKPVSVHLHLSRPSHDAQNTQAVVFVC